jgi:hypothetical protein
MRATAAARLSTEGGRETDDDPGATSMFKAILVAGTKAANAIPTIATNRLIEVSRYLDEVVWHIRPRNFWRNPLLLQPTLVNQRAHRYQNVPDRSNGGDIKHWGVIFE